MENYEYIEVDRDEVGEDDDNKPWKYFLRQAFVFSTMWVMFFVNGMSIGAPAVLIPQLRKERNSTEFIEESMFSWLTSIHGFSAIPWVSIMPIAASYIGRKYPFVFATIAMVVANVVFYCSKNVIQILISEALNTIVNCILTTVGNSMVIAEYMSPEYRGMFLSFKSATFFWGIWLSNAIGAFFHWKYIPLTMMILSIYPAISVYFWPESPYYLSNKSKYDACIKSQRWLKGSNKLAEKELHKLLSSRSSSATEEPTLREVILSKRFYKATLLCICLFTLNTLTGKIAYTMYSIDIIMEMTSSEKAAYTGMLILDGVTVLSMYIGSMLTRIVKRKVLLFFSTSVGIVSMYCLSLYVYLVNSLYISDSKFLSIVLLSIYSIGVGCGPIILAISLFAELAPLQYKSLSVCLIGTIDKLVMGVVVHVTPIMIRIIGLHGTFLFFGLSSMICLWLLYLYMPETKDKTLFEISDAIQGKEDISCNKNETAIKLT